MMNVLSHSVRVGLRRGWTDFRHSLVARQDVSFYVFTGLGALVFLYVNRNNPVEGTTLMMPSVLLPSIIGAALMFGLVVGPAFALAMEREDGTLLRAKAAPHGIKGYVVGQLLFQSLSLLPGLGVILIPSMFLFDDLMPQGATGWFTVLWVLALGLVATLPLGMIIGSLVKNIQKVMTWGMLPVMVLGGISGILYPMQSLWGWVQIVAQVFPMYWLGLGMRSAFLPDAAAALEIGGSWRTLETVVVLSMWAVAGLIVTPVVVRRTSRRQSGSAVQEARDAAATLYVQ